MIKEKKESKDIDRCLMCNSTMTYIRLKTKERVCRNCGFIEKIKEKKNGKSS